MSKSFMIMNMTVYYCINEPKKDVLILTISRFLEQQLDASIMPYLNDSV